MLFDFRKSVSRRDVSRGACDDFRGWRRRGAYATCRSGGGAVERVRCVCNAGFEVVARAQGVCNAVFTVVARVRSVCDAHWSAKWNEGNPLSNPRLRHADDPLSLSDFFTDIPRSILFAPLHYRIGGIGCFFGRWRRRRAYAICRSGVGCVSKKRGTCISFSYATRVLDDD